MSNNDSDDFFNQFDSRPAAPAASLQRKAAPPPPPRAAGSSAPVAGKPRPPPPKQRTATSLRPSGSGSSLSRQSQPQQPSYYAPAPAVNDVQNDWYSAPSSTPQVWQPPSSTTAQAASSYNPYAQPYQQPQSTQQQSSNPYGNMGYNNNAGASTNQWAAAAPQQVPNLWSSNPSSSSLQQEQQQPLLSGSMDTGAGSTASTTMMMMNAPPAAQPNIFNPASTTTTTTTLSKSSSYDFENEPPLLEELGINIEHIYLKTKAVVIPIKRFNPALMDPDMIVQDADLAGPLAFALLLGGELLLTGKLHFGYIYGFGLFGCLAMCLILNLMAKDGVNIWTVTSILGYSLLPVNVLAALKIVLVSVLKLDTLGRALGLLTVLWSTVASTRLLEVGCGMRSQRYLVAYPIAMLYSAFVLITIF